MKLVFLGLRESVPVDTEGATLAVRRNLYTVVVKREWDGWRVGGRTRKVSC